MIRPPSDLRSAFLRGAVTAAIVFSASPAIAQES